MATYHVDLQQFSLEKLKTDITGPYLLPSRRMLLEDIDARFARLQELGISNLATLIERLSTAKKMDQFAVESGIPTAYLTMLRRQARSYIPSPVYFKDIPGLDAQHVQSLEQAGIRQAKQLYEKVLTPQQRSALSAKSGIPPEALLELTRLTDLTRILYTGPIFVRLLYAAGIDSLHKLSQARADELFERLVAVNDELKLTKAMFTRNDIAVCITAAANLPVEVQYE